MARPVPRTRAGSPVFKRHGPARHSRLDIDGIAVEVTRRNIRNLHLRVYPPDGRVCVSAPRDAGDGEVQRLVRGNLQWIRSVRARLAAQPAAAMRAFRSGETHHYLGRACPLLVHEGANRQGASLHEDGTLELRVKAGADLHAREQVLYGWYRRQMKTLLPGMIDRWAPRVGVEVAEWGVRRMSTRWGSCNIGARRIWLNLELIRMPAGCIEYVLVHELVHLRERYHNARFHALVAEAMPDWREHRDRLHGAGGGPDPD